ncbi:hypothetical protein FHT44_005146 [Mycolicibacterium sp. BK634]|nr:hypothetical protein [Mycolicibacterium sp. BK634]MBB3752634.1 hypothetical protein [Mycolicibacterium sp. BK634]
MKRIIDMTMSQQDWEDYAQAIEKVDPARAQLIREHAANLEVAVNP